MDDKGHIPLRELAARVENVLSGGALTNLWVVAEINNLNVTPSSGHCYLELVERDPLRGQTITTMRANIWASRYKMVSHYFAESTGCTLSAGMKVLCCCSVTYHPLYGLALNITDIDPAYTIGETERQRNLTISTLKQDGVFNMNKELELPLVIQRVAIISSQTAAGYGDFLHQLQNTPYDFYIQLFPSVMQGNEAEKSVINALTKIAENETNYDCVVIIRGGGATTDLQCFDSYRMCSYIAQMPLPVITGIGHERDISVADLVANTSLKTPTAVAAHIISSAENFWNSLLYFHQKVQDTAQRTIMAETARTESISSKISALATTAISTQNLRIDRLTNAISQSARQSISQRLNTLSLISQKLAGNTTYLLESSRNKLQHLTELILAHNPRNILSRGYAIITTANGETLTDAAKIKPGDTLNIELENTIISTTVNNKHTK